MVEATTTRPSRSRAAKTTAAKAAPAKAAPKTQPAEAEAPKTERVVVTLEPHPDGHSKSYTRWVPPKSSGCVGTFYAPLGVETVRVALEGPAS